MKRPRWVWLGLSLSLALALAGAGWLTATALDLERGAVRSRTEAALEENARLALWRMDSAVAPILAVENARPTVPTDAPGAPRRATDDVAFHFQREPDGRVTAVSGTESPSAERLETLRRALATSSIGAPMAVEASQAVAQQADPPKLQASTQKLKSAQEWQSRNLSVERGNRYSYDLANAAPSGVHARGRSPPTGELLLPVWLGDTLILARRVRGAEGTLLQGAVLDWVRLRGSLLREVGDLLEGAALEPVSGNDARLEHRLATLPVRLLPGRAVGPAEVDAGATAVRLVLAVAWTAMLLAGAALGALLIGTLALSERRAAFVSSVTHELRTPLTTFRMYTEMLTTGMVTDAQQCQQYLETLHRESERLSHLVENVLSYSRIERGRGPAPAERVAVQALIERHVDRWRERARQVGLDLVVQPAPLDLAVLANASAVEQVLFNLVDNAAKYAAQASPARVEIAASAEGKRVALRVRDFGPGLDAEAERGLFTPFSKSAQRAALSAPGVGLGLALCKRLATEMRGELRRESPVGGGTAFVLVLPRA